MGRPRHRTDYVSIVEACYEARSDDGEWLAELLSTALPALDLGHGIGLSLVHETPGGRNVELSHGIGGVGQMLSHSWPLIRQLDEDVYQRFFYPRQPVVLASSLVKQFEPPYQHAFASMMNYAGSRDLLGMLGYPSPGWAFAMFVAVSDATRIRGLLRRTLQRLRIHVEASLRLRRFAPSQAVAVLSPDGQLLHATGELAQEPGRSGLARRTQLIDRARSRQGRTDAHRALAAWQALVEGRWSLVERRESDGKRYYHAFENAPHVRHHRALNQKEALIVQLSLRGLTGKEVAYETGLSQTCISASLANAAERLGLSGRAELMRLAGNLHVDARGSAGSRARLTDAEREVLELLQRGLSNRAIAELRKVSLPTVAKQVASLLRKTGAHGRRALLLR